MKKPAAPLINPVTVYEVQVHEHAIKITWTKPPEIEQVQAIMDHCRAIEEGTAKPPRPPREYRR